MKNVILIKSRCYNILEITSQTNSWFLDTDVKWLSFNVTEFLISNKQNLFYQLDLGPVFETETRRNNSCYYSVYMC